MLCGLVCLVQHISWCPATPEASPCGGLHISWHVPPLTVRCMKPCVALYTWYYSTHDTPLDLSRGLGSGYALEYHRAEDIELCYTHTHVRTQCVILCQHTHVRTQCVLLCQHTCTHTVCNTVQMRAFKVRDAMCSSTVQKCLQTNTEVLTNWN